MKISIVHNKSLLKRVPSFQDDISTLFQSRVIGLRYISKNEILRNSREPIRVIRMSKVKLSDLGGLAVINKGDKDRELG